MTDENRPEANEEPLIDAVDAEEIGDPIGDETDGEAAESEAEIEAAEEDGETQAEDEPEVGTEEDSEEEDEPERKPRPPAKPERLQKIIAAAGVASRRKAEEIIEQGRVQVNGKVVTEPGTKADLGRDHIRVDGKLLQGAERHRYFVLNKPRGFVTTVKDPEGRPTVMQFFEKMRERLYPVGRLDYMSEGLLLVTNDGELANKLTRASAGVEKTYLVKVSGIPSEDELDVLRAGVAIEKGKPGSGKVRTSPARIRQVRQGDNPWYEVVLIEGRNRELRKMFEEIGHFVEKIRRVGYGPLILDQEPGNLRELDEQELSLLRRAADGKLKTPKAKEIRRRNMIDSLPPEKPAFRPRGAKPAAGPKDYQPKKAFGTERPGRGGAGKFGTDRPGPVRFGSGPAKFGTARPAEGAAPRPAWKKDAPPAGRPPARFAAGSGSESRPPANRTYSDRPAAGRSYGKPAAGRTFGGKPAGRGFTPSPGDAQTFPAKPAARSFGAKPGWKKPESGDRPAFKRPSAPRPDAIRRPAPEPMDDEAPRKPFKLHIEPVQDFDRTERTGRASQTDRSRPSRPASGRPPAGYSGGARTGSGRFGADRGGEARSGSTRPFRSEGGLARPFTTSSGKPRAGGARPSTKPGNRTAGRGGPSTGRPSSARPSSARPSSTRPSTGRPARPYTPRGQDAEGFSPRGEDSRPERRTGTGWKPKPNFSARPGTGSAGAGKPRTERAGTGKPAFGDRAKPRPGGFSKPGSTGGAYKGKSGGSGYKGKPGGGTGAKRSAPRPGGKKPEGKRH
jgi:23S rRNA pseudouridine2605 synthase